METADITSQPFEKLVIYIQVIRIPGYVNWTGIQIVLITHSMQLHYTKLTHMIIKYLSHSYEHMRGTP